METTTDLIKPEDVNIPALTTKAEDVIQTIHENLGQMQLNVWDFTRLKIPVGGATNWTVQTLQGETQVPVIVGVIAQQRDVRAFWRRAFGAGEAGPPDCQSLDMVMGVGDPGGPCQQCKYNIFGTKPLPGGGLGKGKACGESKQLMFYREDLMPELLQLPATSLKAARQYLLKLGANQLPYYGVVTAIRLERVMNSGGIPYAEARFRAVRKLTFDELARMKQWSELLAGYMQAAPIDIIAEDTGGPEQ